MSDDARVSRIGPRQIEKLSILGFRWVVIVLCLYWLAIFSGTHLPRPPRALPRIDDKLVHFLAYFGLAAALAFCIWALIWLAGKLRNFVSVFLNDEDIRHQAGLETPVADGDRLAIVPAIAGGAPAPLPPQQGLSNEEIHRYSRHLIMPEVTLEGQKRLKNGSVLLIGAGGLGSPASLYLAAAGVGRLGIVDNDVVDVSNLQRQVMHGEDRVGAAVMDVTDDASVEQTAKAVAGRTAAIDDLDRRAQPDERRGVRHRADHGDTGPGSLVECCLCPRQSHKKCGAFDRGFQEQQVAADLAAQLFGAS